MSYILEALKKSEQARRQNTAAREFSLLPAVAEEFTARRHWPYALAAALLINAGGVYLWVRPTFPDSVAAVRAPSVTQPAETLAANLVDIAPAIPLEQPATVAVDPVPTTSERSSIGSAVANVPPAPRTPAPTQALAKKSPSLERKPSPVPPAGRAASPVTVAAASAPVAAKVATPPAAQVAAPVAPRVAAVDSAKPAADAASTPRAELPAVVALPSPVQPELPSITVAGFIRDSNASGMVIVNDRLLREGDEVAPGLKIEKISDDRVVFNYKGQRFVR